MEMVRMPWAECGWLAAFRWCGEKAPSGADAEYWFNTRLWDGLAEDFLSDYCLCSFFSGTENFGLP